MVTNSVASTIPGKANATWIPSSLEQRSQQAVAPEEQQQHIPGDNRRNSERHVHQSIDQITAGKTVADKYPGYDCAKDGMDDDNNQADPQCIPKRCKDLRMVERRKDRAKALFEGAKGQRSNRGR